MSSRFGSIIWHWEVPQSSSSSLRWASIGCFESAKRTENVNTGVGDAAEGGAATAAGVEALIIVEDPAAKIRGS